MKLATAVILVIACVPALLSASPPTKKRTWYEIASNDDFSFSLKAEPIKVTNTSRGDEASTIVQFRDKKKNQVAYAEWTISGSDCKRGYGILTAQDLDGSNRVNNNYVQDGENAIGLVGSEICKDYLQTEKYRLERAATCTAQLAEARRDFELSKTQITDNEAQNVANTAAAFANLAATEASCESGL